MKIFFASLFFSFLMMNSFATPVLAGTPTIPHQLSLKGHAGFVPEDKFFQYSIIIDFQQSTITYFFQQGHSICEQANVPVELRAEYAHIPVLANIADAADNLQVTPFHNDVVAADCNLDQITYTTMSGNYLTQKSATRNGTMCLHKGYQIVSGEETLLGSVGMSFYLNPHVPKCAQTAYQILVQKRAPVRP